MTIKISHFAFTLSRRNMIISMSLKLEWIYVWMCFCDNIYPTTTFSMRLLSTMITTTLIAMMINLNLFFGIIKCLKNILAFKYITIKVLTKHFCCFITYSILRVNHNNILNSNLKECLSNFLRMTRIYKN